MNVTGFLIEDDQGQEFVVVCETPNGKPGNAFAIRGWQRRRLVPLQCTGQELRHLTREVRSTLNDLLHSTPESA